MPSIEPTDGSFMPNSPLIFVKALDGQGGALTYTDTSNIRTCTAAQWLHFDANHPRTLDLVHTTFPDIDEQSLQVMFDHDARPRTLQLDNAVLIILRGINHNKGDEPEDMMAVRLWVTDTHIISLRYRKSKAVMEVAETFDQNRGPKTVGDTVTMICASLFGYIENSIDKLNERIDLLESRVLDKPDKQLRHDISEVRKSAILLRRYIAPQKEAMYQLRYTEAPWLSAKNLRRTQESQDILLRGIEELDTIRERSQVVKDELINTLSDKLNRNLYVLSVITAIFLPLGFLTGLFGVNLGGMPGIEQDWAFAFFSFGLLVLVGVQIVLFRFFNWF